MSELSEQNLFKQKAEPERFLILPKADEMIRCKDKFTLGEGSSRGAEELNAAQLNPSWEIEARNSSMA